MSQRTGSANSRLSDDGLESRMAIAEELLNKIVAIHVSTATNVQGLTDKLNRLDTTASAISSFMRKMDTISTRLQQQSDGGGRSSAAAATDTAEIRSGMAEVMEARLRKTEEMVAQIHQQLATMLERTSPQPAAVDITPDAVVGKDLINKFESQQSSILQVLEQRTDPRLMIYLKPLIEMLEEEGRQATRMKDVALQQLNDLLTGKRSGTNQQISHTLQNVGTEIEKCQAAFERTQQALQMVISPFQQVGQLFRDNLEIIVQAHDLLAELHADLPKFLDEMKALHREQRSS
ncbi:MAG: hypothetical protein HQL58_01015 [Magnetococcales bacterium]|nr:hypothetical protein [Magnetococcales bacterium]